MADLHIFREHTLGLVQARKIASKWAEQAQTDFGMACSYIEGEGVDEVSFSRSGVKGKLDVDATRFELRVQLGFLLGAFKHRIEAEIVNNLDTLLAAPSPKRASRKKAKSAE
jgi:putative polyhydroxyalkanoate system protein